MSNLSPLVPAHGRADTVNHAPFRGVPRIPIAPPPRYI
jgi:hypothetical protein